MGASTGHKAEGENQKKWLLVRPLETQSRILRSRLFLGQCRPSSGPSTEEVYWNRMHEVTGNKDLWPGAKIYFYIKKRQTLVIKNLKQYWKCYLLNDLLWRNVKELHPQNEVFGDPDLASAHLIQFQSLILVHAQACHSLHIPMSLNMVPVASSVTLHPTTK